MTKTTPHRLHHSDVSIILSVLLQSSYGSLHLRTTSLDVLGQETQNP